MWFHQCKIHFRSQGTWRAESLFAFTVVAGFKSCFIATPVGIPIVSVAYLSSEDIPTKKFCAHKCALVDRDKQLLSSNLLSWSTRQEDDTFTTAEMSSVFYYIPSRKLHGECRLTGHTLHLN